MAKGPEKRAKEMIGIDYGTMHQSSPANRLTPFEYKCDVSYGGFTEKELKSADSEKEIVRVPEYFLPLCPSKVAITITPLCLKEGALSQQLWIVEYQTQIKKLFLFIQGRSYCTKIVLTLVRD